MWDSEQFSQAPMSCSQGSQNSSSDLFSQSKTSQLKGFNSFDVWSQPTNSQQISEVCNAERLLNSISEVGTQSRRTIFYLVPKFCLCMKLI